MMFDIRGSLTFGYRDEVTPNHELEWIAMSVKNIALFPDTNLFLHYRPLSEIDWCCLAQGLIRGQTGRIPVQHGKPLTSRVL